MNVTSPFISFTMALKVSISDLQTENDNAQVPNDLLHCYCLFAAMHFSLSPVSLEPAQEWLRDWMSTLRHREKQI